MKFNIQFFGPIENDPGVPLWKDKGYATIDDKLIYVTTDSNHEYINDRGLVLLLDSLEIVRNCIRVWGYDKCGDVYRKVYIELRHPKDPGKVQDSVKGEIGMFYLNDLKRIMPDKKQREDYRRSIKSIIKACGFLNIVRRGGDLFVRVIKPRGTKGRSDYPKIHLKGVMFQNQLTINGVVYRMCSNCKRFFAYEYVPTYRECPYCGKNSY